MNTGEILQMLETNIHAYFAFGYDYFMLRFEMKGGDVRGSHKSLAAFLDDFFNDVG